MWKSAPGSPVPFVDFAVRPGQYVKKNDPLFTVSQDYGGKQGSVVQFDRQQMEAEKKRSEQRIQAIEDSIASYRKNLAQQLALTDKQIAVSRDKVKKLRALLKTAPTPTRRGNPSPGRAMSPEWISIKATMMCSMRSST